MEPPGAANFRLAVSHLLFLVPSLPGLAWRSLGGLLGETCEQGWERTENTGQGEPCPYGLNTMHWRILAPGTSASYHCCHGSILGSHTAQKDLSLSFLSQEAHRCSQCPQHWWLHWWLSQRAIFFINIFWAILFSACKFRIITSSFWIKTSTNT